MWPLEVGLEPSTLGWLGKCSTTVQQLLENVQQTFLPFYLPVWAQESGLEPSTLGWLGKCSTTVLQLLEDVLPTFLLFHLPIWLLAPGLKPATLGWLGKCSTTVLQLLESVLLSPNVTTRGWTQTLNLRMIRQVLYHCTTAPRKCTTNFLAILSPKFDY
jgi:hypothetical protein